MAKRYFLRGGAIVFLCFSGLAGCTWGELYEFLNSDSEYRCKDEPTPVDKEICRKRHLSHEEYEEERRQMKKRS